MVVCSHGRVLLLGWLVCVVGVILCTLSVAADGTGAKEGQEANITSFSDPEVGSPEVKATSIHKRSASPPYNEAIFRSLTSFCSQLSSYGGADRGTSPGFRVARSSGSESEMKDSRRRKKKKRKRKNRRKGRKSKKRRKYDEVIFRSLASFCSKLNSYTANAEPTDPPTQTRPGISGNKTTPVSAGHNETSHTPRQPAFTKPRPDWSGPDVFPAKLDVERSGESVVYTFHVIHTSEAYVVRSNSLEYLHIPIPYPANTTGPVESPVKVTVDAAFCKDQVVAKDVRLEFIFNLKEKPKLIVLSIINTCYFDKVWIGTSDGKVGQWETRKGTISQELPPPLLKLNPDPGDEIVVPRYKGVTVTADVPLLRVEFRLSAIAFLWDRAKRTELYSGHDMRAWLPKDGGLKTLDSVGSLVRTDIKNELNKTKGDCKCKTAKLTVAVDTSGGTISGVLFLSDIWMPLQDTTHRPNVRFLQTVREIRLMQPNVTEIYPASYVKIRKKWKYKCDDTGNRLYGKYGRNCTVFCSATGPNITTIAVEKVVPNVQPVRSASYNVSKDLAFAIVDMGPVSKEIDGEYRCIVHTADGSRQTETLVLEAGGFTDIKAVTIHEFINGTTKVTCTAYGRQLSRVEVSIGDKNKREKQLPGSSNYTSQEISYGDYKDVTFYVPTDQLRYPKTYVECYAVGKRGIESKKEYLPWHVSRYSKLPRFVKQLPETGYVYTNGNGTVTVGCTSVGVSSIPLKVFLGETDLLAISASNVTHTSTEFSTSVQLVVPLDHVRGKSPWIECRSRNLFGRDRHRFDIADFTSLE